MMERQKKPNTSVALFPLSADPPTLGHLHVIERAAALYEKLYVVVFKNAQKSPFLNEETRLKLLKENLKHCDNILYEVFSGLVSDYCMSRGITVMIRSLRNAVDFDYEAMLEEGNRGLLASLEVVYLRSTPLFQHISSTAARNLLAQNAFTHQYLPSNVKEYLELRKDIFLVGYTGSISVGKTYLGVRLQDHLRSMKLEAHYVDLDRVVHQMYTFEDDRHGLLKQALMERFGKEFFQENGALDRKALSKHLYANGTNQDWKALNSILHPHLLSEIQHFTSDHKGYIFLDGAVLVENGMLPLVNGNLILVDCPPEEQLKRLMNRDNISHEEAVRKVEKAGSTQTKKALYHSQRKTHGQLWELHSTEDIPRVADELIVYFTSRKSL